MGIPLRVLIIEDSEHDTDMLLCELRKGGYDPVWERVNTAEALMEALEGERWDLVLSDFQMPALDGRDALEFIRAKGMDLPFIVISGFMEDAAVDILKAGANDFIRKGNWSRLVPAIDREVREAESRRERRLERKALQEAEARYRSLFENAVEGIFQSTPQGRFVSVNPAMARIHGYDSPEEMIRNTTDADTQIYVDSNRRREGIRQLLSRGAIQGFEAQIFRKDGSKIWISMNARAIFDDDGELQLIEGMVEDITSRKEAEEERMRLVTAIEQVAEGIAIMDTSWLIRYVNPAFESISGYTKAELIGRHLRIFKSDKHDPAFYRNIREILSRGEIWTGQLIGRRKDGTHFEVEASGSQVRDEAGVLMNYVVVYRDITHEARLERQLRQAQKMEAIGTLAGGIAHDFNNILMAVIGYTEIALCSAPEGSHMRRNLEQVLKAGCRARDLVKQILAFSRQTEQERKPVQIGPIMKEALKLLRASLPSTIEIRYDIPADSGVVLADPSQIHQVLMNLCSNAAHAMREHGGLLDVSLSRVDLDEAAVARYRNVKPGRHLRLSVSDTGHGMEQAVMDRVFEPFFTTKSAGEGTGMGLAVVHGIVRASGGAVSVHSQPGLGATFNVFLPRIDEENLPERESRKPSPVGSERILIVDDEEAGVDTGRQMLELLGYAVVCTTSSIEALEAFRKDPNGFDLVISDQTMPVMTGMELAQELMRVRPDIPVILCTGFSEAVSAERAKAIGIREFILKPVVMHQLAETVRSALGGGRGPERGK